MAHQDIPYTSFASTSDDTEEEGGPWATDSSGYILPHHIISGSSSIPMLGFTGLIFAELDVSELGAPNTPLHYEWSYQGCYDGPTGTHVITTSVGEDQYSDSLLACPLVSSSPAYQGIVMIDSNNHVKVSIQSQVFTFVVDNATAYVGGFKFQLSADNLATNSTSAEVGRASSSLSRSQAPSEVATSTSALFLSTSVISAPSSSVGSSLSTMLLSVSLPRESIYANPPNFTTILDNSSTTSAVVEQKASSRIVPIVCGTIGGLLLLGLVIMACVWRLRRYRDIHGDYDIGEDGKTVVADNDMAEDPHHEGSLWPRKSYGYGIYTNERVYKESPFAVE